MKIPHLQENVPLAPYTTFKIGGPAKYFIVVKTSDEMVRAVQEAVGSGIAWIVLGGGSDLLVSDAGFDGVVIKSELREVTMNEETGEVTAGSGVLLSALIPKTMNAGLAGLEYAIGVPATVGGAIWANLGARGSDIAQWLTSVTVLTASGEKKVLTNADCQFAYRDSIFKHETFSIVEATFVLKKMDKKVTFAKMKELADLRKDTQDVGAQCAGCVFQNPTDQTDVAAASDIHANFIINTGDATADDVVQLISFIKQQVRDKKGIQLHEEIEYIGF
jgi:UDP-N-acetylmuramate dehydrogenase